MENENINVLKAEESDKILYGYYSDYQNLFNYMPELEKKMKDQVKLVLKNKSFSDINKVDQKGNSLLHYAISENCSIDMTVNLLKAGADITLDNKRGANCFQYAGQRNYGSGSKYFTRLLNNQTIREFLFENKDLSKIDPFKKWNKETLKFLLIAHHEEINDGTIQQLKEKAKYLDILEEDYFYYAIGKKISSFFANKEEIIKIIKEEVSLAVERGPKSVSNLLLDITLGMASKGNATMSLFLWGKMDGGVISSIEKEDFLLNDSDKKKLANILNSFKIVEDNVFLSKNMGSEITSGFALFMDFFKDEILANLDYYKDALFKYDDWGKASKTFQKKFIELDIIKETRQNKATKNIQGNRTKI